MRLVAQKAPLNYSHAHFVAFHVVLFRETFYCSSSRIMGHLNDLNHWNTNMGNSTVRLPVKWPSENIALLFYLCTHFSHSSSITTPKHSSRSDKEVDATWNAIWQNLLAHTTRRVAEIRYMVFLGHHPDHLLRSQSCHQKDWPRWQAGKERSPQDTGSVYYY